MLGDFLGRIFDAIEYLWPFRIVEQWERGIYSIFGRAQPTWVVQRGIWPVVPFFITLVTKSVAWAPIKGSRQDVTLKDGSHLTFQAGALVRVSDVYKAVVEVEKYEESTIEILEAVFADKLTTEVDPQRLESNRRGRLLTSLQNWFATDVGRFGIEVDSVWFSMFVHKPKSFRLLGDVAARDTWS